MKRPAAPLLVVTLRALPAALSGGLAVMLAGGLPALLAGGRPAWAQVSVDPGALDALRKAPAAEPVRRPAARRAGQTRGQRPTVRHGKAEERAAPTKAPPAAAAVQVPAAPPNPVALPPPAVTVPVRPAPPPPVSIAADAPGAVSTIDHGLRLTFGDQRAELNPAGATALAQFAKSLPPDAVVTVRGYAAGNGDDPSTPRRLSLQRALAARAELIHQGIASPRIYVRAEGDGAASTTEPGAPAGPADRVDVVASAPAVPKS